MFFALRPFWWRVTLAIGGRCLSSRADGRKLVACCMRPERATGGLLVEISAHRVQWMYASKAIGAWHLQSNMSRMPLDARVLFSSVGSGLGNIGQANYAAGNACLDALAHTQRAHGLVTCSLQWPLIGGAGMGAAAVALLGERQLDVAGMMSISLDGFAACLRMQLTSSVGCAMAVQLVHRAVVGDVLRDLSDPSQPRFAELAAEYWPGAGAIALAGTTACVAAKGSKLLYAIGQCPPSERRSQIESLVLRAVRELTGAPSASLTAETPLMEAGVDSMAATELSSRLRALTGEALSPTLVFEEPTARAIAMHLLEQSQGSTVGACVVGTAVDAVERAGVEIAAGAVGRWPGGCNSQPGRMRLLQGSGDAMGSVPASRWTLASVVDVELLTSVQASSAKHGGFISSADRFDALCFHISQAEAAAMDPQQRLLLEHGYASLHGTARRRATLMGGDDGVFLGIERPDWSLAQPPAARGSVYAVTGDNVSVAAGRVSFALGLQGPCASVDAACASALVAMHEATHAVSDKESTGVLAMAVSLKLVPHGTLGAALAGMLSVDGRCKTFDARANGYARSEAVGALVLEHGGSSCALLGGSAVRQDGRSASLTAPNGSAQRTLLLTVLRRASLSPVAVRGIEAHGTGTPLGDPTEAGALAAVY